MPISCRQCGWQSPDGANFCVNNACGAYLEWEGERSQRPPHDPVVHAQRPSPSDPRGNVAEQRVGVQVAVAEQQLEVEPGSSVTTVVTVHNTGTQVENFRLVVHGPAGAWATVEPESVSVYPGSEAVSTLRFAPPRSAAAPAARAWYSVRAVSTLHPGLEAGVDGTLTVAAFRELDAELVPRSSRGRFRTMHTVRLANRGNVVEPVALAASDSEDLLRFAIPPGEVPVQPGTGQVDVTVRAPWRLIGRPRTHPFQVVVTPRATLPPLPLDGSRDSVPLFARWVPITAAAVLLLAALASLVVPRLQVAAQDGGSARQQPSATAELPPPQEPAPQESAPQESPAAEPPPPENPPPAAPPEEEQQPPPAAPPTTSPPPSVRAEGKLLIPQTFQADLDEAAVTNEGADIFFEADTATKRFVTPRNGALLAAIGTVEPSFQRCADSALAKDRIPIQDLPASSVICVLTDEQRVSVVRVDSPPGPSPGVLGISFTTFES